MLKQFLYTSLIMLIFAVSNGVAQQSTIYTRLQTTMPVLNPNSCSVFMLPYGASDKDIRKTASRFKLQYLTKEPLEKIPGAYLLIYRDPDNIIAPNGEIITSSVVYIFTLHPSIGYFSYSVRMIFTEDVYADNALQSLQNTISKNLSVENFKTVNFAVTRCDDESNMQFGDTRIFSCVEDPIEPGFIFTVMDMNASEKLEYTLQQPSKNNNKRK